MTSTNSSTTPISPTPEEYNQADLNYTINSENQAVPFSAGDFPVPGTVIYVSEVSEDDEDDDFDPNTDDGEYEDDEDFDDDDDDDEYYEEFEDEEPPF